MLLLLSGARRSVAVLPSCSGRDSLGPPCRVPIPRPRSPSPPGWLVFSPLVQAFYSTPQIYTEAKHASGPELSVKEDDFFPYADCPVRAGGTTASKDGVILTETVSIAIGFWPVSRLIRTH